MKLRRLNEAGIERFSDYIDSLFSDAPEGWPEELLTEIGLTDPVANVEIEHRGFSTRLELASYLDEHLSAAKDIHIEKDVGIWAWLALFYFREICPVDRDGNMTPGAKARWIPESADFRRYYRHLLAGPYLIFRAHRDNPDRALALLCGVPGKPGEIVEQLASRQELVSSSAVVEVATRLYVDPNTRAAKPGTSGKGAGSPRRLAEILNQFDVTWDFAVMEPQDLLDMLPKEFSRFLMADAPVA